MTDKQIIIDGVDVIGCEKQGETIDGITCGIGERIRLANEIITKHKLCKDTPNCLYKQLKRKEQEYKALKTENKELKKELGAVYDNCKGCPTCNEALYNANLYAKEYRKLKQTLAEIKGIAENMNEECFYDDFDCEDCDMKNGCTYINKKLILQKISEVIEDENQEM